MDVRFSSLGMVFIEFAVLAMMVISIWKWLERRREKPIIIRRNMFLTVLGFWIGIALFLIAVNANQSILLGDFTGFGAFALFSFLFAGGLVGLSFGVILVLLKPINWVMNQYIPRKYDIKFSVLVAFPIVIAAAFVSYWGAINAVRYLLHIA